MSLLFGLKLACIVPTLLITLAGGYYPLWHKLKNKIGKDFAAGESLACGIFLGAGLLHMLPEAAKGFSQQGYHYPAPFLITGMMFLLLLLLEHVGREVYHHEGKNSLGFVLLSVMMLSIHSFITGVTLGVSDSSTMVLIILLAILAHKWAASFALAVQISSSRIQIRTGIALFMFFALMLPIGVILGSVIMNGLTQAPLLEPILSALAAGTFMYLGTLHGLKQAVMIEQCCDLRRFTYVNIGFALMGVVAIWV